MTEVDVASKHTHAIDLAIEAESEALQAAPLRRIHPIENQVVKYDWPAKDKSRSNRLWFDGVDIIEIQAMSINGVDLAAENYVLHPVNAGPPYRWLEIKDTSPTFLTSGADRQNAIELTATTGYDASMVFAGYLCSELEASVDDLAVINSCNIGVGSLLKIGEEWLTVRNRFWLESMDMTTAPIDRLSNHVQIEVASFGDYMPGEHIRIGQEVMRVESFDMDRGAMIVDRSVKGSVLAEHDPSTVVYRKNLYQLERGALDSVTSEHLDKSVVEVWKVPALIRQLVVAESLVNLNKSVTGFPIDFGGSSNVALESLREKVWRKYKRPPVYRRI